MIIPDDGKISQARLNQHEINALAQFLDYHRTDKSNDYIPSDEQVDAWIKTKGVRYAESGCKPHGRRN